ncbi:shikimate kinase, partial [Roseicyclus sp.]|uniref:shikimate kinase n=1 Tax=Roseicyclus sp. TaxID=1914329 RepID=UPI003F6AE1B0
MSQANRALLTENAVVLWLQADLELLWQRVRHKNTRPLLRTADPRASLAALYEQRAPIYALAPYQVAVAPEWSVEETTEHVFVALTKAGAIEEYQT